MSDIAVELDDALRRAPFGELLETTRDALAALAAESEAADESDLLGPAVRDSGLFVLLDGSATVLDVTPDTPAVAVRVLRPGGAFDPRHLGAIATDLRVPASGPVSYAMIGAAALEDLVADSPDLRAALDRLHRRTLLCRLHGLLGALDEDFLDRLERMSFLTSLSRGGQMVIRRSLPDLFLVISGRVRILRDGPDGADDVVGEAALGEMINENAFFGLDTPPGRVVALRDSMLIGLAPDEFDSVTRARPGVLRRVTRSLVQRLHRPSRRAAAAPITNIALVPLAGGEQSDGFASDLERVLGRYGRVLRLDADIVDRRLGVSGVAQAESGSDAERLGAWLDARERDHRFVLYVTEPAATAWTRRCLRHADRVLLVADAAADPRPGAAERDVLAYTDGLVGAIETLVLLHLDGSRPPRGTRRWLEHRRVEDHLHVRRDRDDDMERLGRMLAGRTLGLALGGGGARGFAHVGILQAFAEAGIAIDRVAGTSIGASVAALHAMGLDPDAIAAVYRRVWIDIEPQKGYTLPLVSVISDHRTRRCARYLYADYDIEDAWIPFVCVSSNLTTAEPRVHETGPLGRAVTASLSVPGIAPPVLDDGHLLVDGGLLENVPATVLHEVGCGVVVGAEVSVEVDHNFAVDHVPTAWEALRARFRSRRSSEFPTIGDLALRAVMLHSRRREREALQAADLTLHPPVDDFRLMDFGALDDLVAIGAAYARERISEWLADPDVASRLPVTPLPGASPAPEQVGSTRA